MKKTAISLTLLSLAALTGCAAYQEPQVVTQVPSDSLPAPVSMNSPDPEPAIAPLNGTKLQFVYAEARPDSIGVSNAQLRGNEPLEGDRPCQEGVFYEYTGTVDGKFFSSVIRFDECFFDEIPTFKGVVDDSTAPVNAYDVDGRITFVVGDRGNQQVSILELQATPSPSMAVTVQKNIENAPNLFVSDLSVLDIGSEDYSTLGFLDGSGGIIELISGDDTDYAASYSFPFNSCTGSARITVLPRDRENGRAIAATVSFEQPSGCLLASGETLAYYVTLADYDQEESVFSTVETGDNSTRLLGLTVQGLKNPCDGIMDYKYTDGTTGAINLGACDSTQEYFEGTFTQDDGCFGDIAVTALNRNRDEEGVRRATLVWRGSCSPDPLTDPLAAVVERQ